MKEGFSVDIYWYIYICQITNQTKGLINYLIDPTFDNVNKLSVLGYENEKDKSSFSKNYTPSVEIKDCNILIDQQPFFELPVRNKKETYEKIVDIGTNSNDYTTGGFLDYDYFLNHYKLIATDLSRQDIDLTN